MSIYAELGEQLAHAADSSARLASAVTDEDLGPAELRLRLRRVEGDLEDAHSLADRL